MEPAGNRQEVGAQFNPNIGPNVGQVELNLPTHNSLNKTAEQQTVSAEAIAGQLNAAYAGAASALSSTSLPTKLPPLNMQQLDTTASIASTSPITAADDDLIEKEWVDRAKQIVTETHNEPYARDEAVDKLRQDYKSKRYGVN